MSFIISTHKPMHTIADQILNFTIERFPLNNTTVRRFTFSRNKPFLQGMKQIKVLYVNNSADTGVFCWTEISAVEHCRPYVPITSTTWRLLSERRKDVFRVYR